MSSFVGAGPGGGGTASLKVTTHSQTTAPRFSGLSAPEFSLTAPYFWELQTTDL